MGWGVGILVGGVMTCSVRGPTNLYVDGFPHTGSVCKSPYHARV